MRSVIRRALATLIIAGAAVGCTAGREPHSLFTSDPLPTIGRDAPAQYVFRASQYAFTTDFELAADDPIVAELAALRDDVLKTLELRESDLPIRIVIFDSQQAYHEFLKKNFPELPERRAFFIREGRDQLAVFACRSERLRQDLRHEVTHALLHASIAQVPIWLDEGLAEFFETSDRPGAVNAAHARQLREIAPQGWAPDLARLEKLRDLWQMTQDDYRESWLWAHYLLRHSPQTRSALVAHIRDLESGTSNAWLKDQLSKGERGVAIDLIDHLDSLEPYLPD